jgi:hypothetical protein
VGVSGWLSPLQLYHLLAADGTVVHYNEDLGRSILAKAGLGKFKAFQDEKYVRGASDAVLSKQPELSKVTLD